MSNQDFNAVPIATPSKPGDIKDIESQSLLGADREWGSEAAMEKILRRGFLKKVRHCAILFISMFVLNGFFHCSTCFNLTCLFRLTCLGVRNPFGTNVGHGGVRCFVYV